MGKQMYCSKTMGYICSLFGKTRQAYYDSKKRKEEDQMQDVLVLSMVKEERKEHKRMGTVKLHHKLQEELVKHNVKMGRDKLHKLLSEHDLLVRQRTFKPRTTDSNHPYRRYSNLVRDFEPTGPNQLWASDITYLSTEQGFVYLSLITDCYSRKIVGWSLWPSLSSRGPMNALDMAAADLGSGHSLIHHSDRGIQYCCHVYVRALEQANISISMTENGDPYENAIAERVNGILKVEYELNQTFSDYHQALEQVKKAINLYNNHRPHLSCDMLTPSEAHQQSGVLKKHWKNKTYKKVDEVSAQN